MQKSETNESDEATIKTTFLDEDTILNKTDAGEDNNLKVHFRNMYSSLIIENFTSI